jgi:hypothetical protein
MVGHQNWVLIPYRAGADPGFQVRGGGVRLYLRQGVWGPPPVGPWQSPGGGPGDEAPGSS